VAPAGGAAEPVAFGRAAGVGLSAPWPWNRERGREGRETFERERDMRERRSEIKREGERFLRREKELRRWKEWRWRRRPEKGRRGKEKEKKRKGFKSLK